MTTAVRPTQIDAILKIIDSELPADMGASLEAYLSDLEAKQGLIPPARGYAAKDPTWLYWHGVKRAQQHQERALRKQNNHQ
jgi:hypothetical protein